MKATINTVDKTITIDKPILLKDLVYELDNIISDEIWEEYKLLPKVIYVESPIVHNPYTTGTPIIPPYTITCSGNTRTISY